MYFIRALIYLNQINQAMIFFVLENEKYGKKTLSNVRESLLREQIKPSSLIKHLDNVFYISQMLAG